LAYFNTVDIACCRFPVTFAPRNTLDLGYKEYAFGVSTHGLSAGIHPGKTLMLSPPHRCRRGGRGQLWCSQEKSLRRWHV